MLDLILPIIVAVSGFALGYLLAKGVGQAPSLRKINDENTCRKFAECNSLVNSACISGHCNMHCKLYCECGAAEAPPKKGMDEWAEILDEDN